MNSAQTLLRRCIVAVLCVLMTVGVFAAAQTRDKLAELARTGQIDEKASVKAETTARIAAPIATVWLLLVNAQAWPSWNRQIEEVKVAGTLEAGTRFRWKNGSSAIQSQVQLVEPQHRLAWTGTAITAKAIHVWELAPADEGQTQVTVKESMEGFLVKQLFPSDKLMESEKQWLNALKEAAEKRSR